MDFWDVIVDFMLLLPPPPTSSSSATLIDNSKMPDNWVRFVVLSIKVSGLAILLKSWMK